MNDQTSLLKNYFLEILFNKYVFQMLNLEYIVTN